MGRAVQLEGEGQRVGEADAGEGQRPFGGLGRAHEVPGVEPRRPPLWSRDKLQDRNKAVVERGGGKYYEWISERKASLVLMVR